MAKHIQIIVDVTVPDDWTGKEPLADAIEYFVRRHVGDDEPLPAQAVTAWWTLTPVER